MRTGTKKYELICKKTDRLNKTIKELGATKWLDVNKIDKLLQKLRKQSISLTKTMEEIL